MSTWPFAAWACRKSTPVIPKDAVQTIGNQQFVFVAREQPNEFILRSVRLGPETNGFYPVLEGASVGERIVTEGSFIATCPNGSKLIRAGR